MPETRDRSGRGAVFTSTPTQCTQLSTTLPSSWMSTAGATSCGVPQRFIGAVKQQIGKPENHHQRLIHFMGNTGCQCAKRCKLTGLNQFFPGLFEV